MWPGQKPSTGISLLNKSASGHTSPTGETHLLSFLSSEILLCVCFRAQAIVTYSYLAFKEKNKIRQPKKRVDHRIFLIRLMCFPSIMLDPPASPPVSPGIPHAFLMPGCTMWDLPRIQSFLPCSLSHLRRRQRPPAIGRM